MWSKTIKFWSKYQNKNLYCKILSYLVDIFYATTIINTLHFCCRYKSCMKHTKHSHFDLKIRPNLMAEFCRISFLLLSSTTLVRMIMTSYHFHWVFLHAWYMWVRPLNVHTDSYQFNVRFKISFDSTGLISYTRFGCSIKDNTKRLVHWFEGQTCA